MSVSTKIAVLGLTGIGGVIAAAGMASTAFAEPIHDTCHGQVTIGDDIFINPGDRGRGRADLNDQGWIRWYCDDGGGRVAHREDCLDSGDEAMVEVRLSP